MKLRLCLLVAVAVLTGSCDSPSGPSGSEVVTLLVAPDPATVVVEGTLQMQATALDGADAPVDGAPLFWSTEDSLIAGVSSAGVVTGRAPGTVRVAVSSGGISAVAAVIVQPKPVESVTVSPADTMIVVDGEVTLTATVRDAGGGTLAGRPVSWASSAPEVATVDENGRVVGVSVGAAEVSASVEGKVGRATVQVTRKPVVRVEIDPPAAALLPGQTLRFTATALAADGSEIPGLEARWISSNPQVASVSSSGVVTGRALGAVNLTATVEETSASVGVAVGVHPVATVTVNPPSLELPVGDDRVLEATPRAASGAVLTGRSMRWSSSSTGVATVSSNGRVIAVAPGTATITARSEGRSGTASVRVVRREVVSVEIAPTRLNLTTGETGTLSATVRDGNGAALTGRRVTWRSSTDAVARVNGDGQVTAVTPGTATITATSEGMSNTATVTVTARPVATVEISPESLSLRVGDAASLSAVLRASDGTTLSGPVSWSTSDGGIATVASDGRVTAVGVGTARITASSGGVSTEASVTVTPRPVASVEISPASLTLEVGESESLQAVVEAEDGTVLTGREVTWGSDAPDVATVDASGEVTAIGPGSATITATSEGVEGRASLTVTAGPAPSIEVSPSSVTLFANETAVLQATVRDESGEILEGREVVWSSDEESVATVGPDGTVTAHSAGTATITATSDGVSGQASVRVQPNPASLRIVSGNNQNGANNVPLADSLVVAVYDADDQPIEGVLVVWDTDYGRLAPTESRTGADGTARTSWTPIGGGFIFARVAYAEVSGLPRVTFSSRR